MANENREYKSTVFADLFYEDRDAKKNILELYNGIYGTEYTDPALVELTRLDNVIFYNLKNDISFKVKGHRLIMGEHQSTVNMNMPLRQLLYLGREYEKLVPVKTRYQKKLVKIPLPVFYTFYNGQEDYPLEMELRLSDAFEVSPEEGEPTAELVVKVININPDKKHKLLEKCKVLKEYSEFVEITRKYEKETTALEKAVKECMTKGILEEYLGRKSVEVVNMLMAEYSYETELEVAKEEAREEGIEKGMEKGIEKGESTFAKLMQILFAQRRTADAERAAKDAEYRHELMEELLNPVRE